MSEEPQSEEPQNKEPQSTQLQSRCWKKGAKMRSCKKAQLQGLDKDLQLVQETEQPNKVKQEPQETAQSAAPQLEVAIKI